MTNLILRYYPQQSTMTQLSPVGKKALTHITQALIALEKILKVIEDFLLRKCPQFAKNIHTVFVVLKDMASFVPSYIYKSLLYIAIFSILWRKLKKWRERRLATAEQPQKTITKNGQHSNLENLGPEFLVKSKAGNSFVGNARTDIDSFYLEFEQLDDSKPKDFRDIVFFQLMRGYRGAEDRPEQE